MDLVWWQTFHNLIKNHDTTTARWSMTLQQPDKHRATGKSERHSCRWVHELIHPVLFHKNDRLQIPLIVFLSLSLLISGAGRSARHGAGLLPPLWIKVRDVGLYPAQLCWVRLPPSRCLSVARPEQLSSPLRAPVALVDMSGWYGDLMD